MCYACDRCTYVSGLPVSPESGNRIIGIFFWYTNNICKNNRHYHKYFMTILNRINNFYRINMLIDKNISYLTLTLGKGMPTQMTALALLSAKSRPSLTLPRHTARNRAPSGPPVLAPSVKQRFCTYWLNKPLP